MRALLGLRCVAVLLPAIAGPLFAQDRVLVPGNPPLTEAAVGTAAQLYEWALDVRLNEPQYHEFERLLVDRWKQPGGAARAEIVATGARWGDVARMRVTERGAIQPRVQDSLLARLRAGARGDDADRWLLARYAEGHRVLAGGSPPLTQALADRMADYWEWVLDVRFSDRERWELQQLEVSMWGQRDAAWKQNWVTFIPGWWTTMTSLGPVERTVLRVQARTNVLAEIRQTPGDPFDRWRLARYEAAHRPGGDMNPVLVAGAVPLTQDMVTQYCAFVEWRRRLQLTGLGAQQRQQLQQLVVADWKSGDAAARQALLADLGWWLQVFPGLTDAQRQDVIYKNEHTGAYLERLHQSPDANARGWYLSLEALTLETFRYRAVMQNMYIQTWRSMIESNRATMTQIARNLAPSGRYEYDARTGAYDRYTPYVP
ncbi:hypothetical protein J421_5874 (plasmid) [Gemmatirosa kalamazoonensis]|uniref:Uncharacterized protein n=1 Tax=Gemmatirosa kalamazoonensis TaxID=861299 RepID=W0RQZ6_9BACT|nr:hypothetical protein [Gemmatirosa kalamazoonensis]AHG93409.1 hypothetical protein J421_5874 [Gemmatirosa kalamazoonensis]